MDIGICLEFGAWNLGFLLTKSTISRWCISFVGVAGFEPAAFPTHGRDALTGQRHFIQESSGTVIFDFHFHDNSLGSRRESVAINQFPGAFGFGGKRAVLVMPGYSIFQVSRRTDIKPPSSDRLNDVGVKHRKYKASGRNFHHLASG